MFEGVNHNHHCHCRHDGPPRGPMEGRIEEREFFDEHKIGPEVLLEGDDIESIIERKKTIEEFKEAKEIEKKKMATKVGCSAGGVAGGAVIGAIFGGPVGALVGGVFGGVLGNTTGRVINGEEKMSWGANLGGAGIGATIGAVLGFGVPGAIIGGAIGAFIGEKAADAHDKKVAQQEQQQLLENEVYYDI